jgi:hypothetical protein
MATTSWLKDWLADADLNVGTPPLGAPEFMARSAVNNVMREMMGSLRQDWDGSATGGGEWRNPNGSAGISYSSASAVLISGIDARVFFPEGRKVKITYDADEPGYCFVTSSTFSTNTTVNVAFFDDIAPDDVVRNAAMASLEFYNAFGGTGDHGLGRAAFTDDATADQTFVTPAAFTGAAINAAIVTAASSGKQGVLLDVGTYVIETSVNILDKTVLVGRGVNRSILQASPAPLDDAVIQFAEGAGDCVLRDFSVDGNASNQTNNNAHGIVGPPLSPGRGVRIDSVRVHDTYGRGISLSSSTIGYDDWRLINVSVDTTGDAGVHMDGPDVFGQESFLSSIYIRNPGTGGRALFTSQALFLNGQYVVNGLIIDCDLTASHSGAAIELENQNPSSLLMGTQLTNFMIAIGSSTGTGFKCIVMRDKHISVSNGVVSAASASLGLMSTFEQTISNVSFFGGAVGFSVVTSGNIVTGCKFVGGLGDGMNVSGTGNIITGCLFQDNALDGVELNGTIHAFTGCVFRGNGLFGVKFGIAGRSSKFTGNIFYGNGSGNYGGTLIDENYTRLENTVIGVAQNAIGTSEVVVTGMQEVWYPSPFDGVIEFEIELWITMEIDTSTTTVTINIHSGSLKSLSDPVVASDQTTGVAAGTDLQFHVGPILYAPTDTVLNEFITIGVETPTGASHDIKAHGSKSATTVREAARTYLTIRAAEG